MSNFTEEQVNNGNEKNIDRQKLAITTIDNNISVSAGAGSGKTYVLVERFLHILEQKKSEGVAISPQEILAITFTRKAAGEMKERVRSEMKKRLSGSADDFWKSHLADLEHAQITTIHGLCSRLLKENPVELELDPAFNLAEEFEGDEFLESCLADFVRSSLKNQDKDLLTLTNAYGVMSTINQLKDLVGDIHDIVAFGDLTASYQENLLNEAGEKARLCHLIEELANRGDLTKKTAEAVALLKENLTEVLDGINKAPCDFTGYKTYVTKVPSTEKVKKSLQEIKELQNFLVNLDADRASIPLVQAWQKVLQGFAVYYRARKKQDDFLTFDDLEELALKLLKENEEVRHKYQEKFRYIMVDEFQDTNDRQKQIIYLLCGDDANKLNGRKLFVVGDPKQSIYRFRGADVSVFAEVRRAIDELGGENVSLIKNFRTKESIVNACNYVFTQLLGNDKSKDIYFEEVVIGKEEQTGGEKPVLLQIPFDDATKPVAREMEAAVIAKHIKELHNNREVPYEEIAILLSAMTKCDTITEALENYDVPYKVVDGKGFYERQEVLDFIHLLTVLANRRCSLELAGVLRSPYFGFNDEVITRMFLVANEETRCLWDVLLDFDASTLKIDDQVQIKYAQVTLEALRKEAMLLPLPELLQKIMCALKLDAVLYLQDNGAAKHANVKKLVGLAQEYCTAKQGTLASWLEHIANLRKAEARETAANLPVTDAVTIMTIHKSKGLEFDTVYLPMLDRKGSSDVSSIKFHKKLGLGIKALLADGDVHESDVLQQIKVEDKEMQKAERQRQLYVAMTRAKNRLIMSGAYKDGRNSDADNWFNDLRKILGDSDVAEIPEKDKVDMRGEPLAPKKIYDDEEGLMPDAELLEPLPTYGASGRNYFSPSALQTYLHCQRQYYYQQEGMPAFEVEGEGTGSDLPPHVVGSIVHKALELYDGKDLDKAFAMAVEEYAPGNIVGTNKAKAMLERYVASDLYKTLPKNKLKELRFALPMDGFLINGVVDCVVETTKGLMLVDYKTGRPPQMGEVKLGYAYQLAIYKYAVEKLLGKKVVEAKLHFLQDLSEWSMPMDKDYLKVAIALCKNIGDKGKEEDFGLNLASCAYCPYNYLCPQK